ncbi:hypothetical protein M3Y94_01038500 [Aphelenchoides besseyi]|nr:hypothetical protein M3Y94_01038500 [Aphelenchoides besseyi]KAI6223984.1 Protein F26A1.8 [Aphelenchoides besseyi]
MTQVVDKLTENVALVIDVPEQKRRTFNEWFNKYFLEGQTLDSQAPQIDMVAIRNSEVEQHTKEAKRRKQIAIFLPLIVSQILWWSAAIKHDYLELYRHYWQMPTAMIVGSTIAGMTSEAGGAVAFPVMTFVLKTSPTDARDFSLLIQSFGMGMAMFTIIFNRIQVEWRAITYAVVGSIPGVVLGYHCVDPFLSPAQKKMIFVSVWSSFALSLWILNREKKRKVVEQILCFCRWKAVVLLVTGFIGGVFTAFAGSGVDICIFSITTLVFSLSEKIATPTTIISMALTSWFALYWRVMIIENVSPLVWNYIRCSIPVCTIMAPFGSFLASHFHRQVLAHLVYICEFVAMIGFLSTRPAWPLILSSCGILIVAFVFFRLLSQQGAKLLKTESQTVSTTEVKQILLKPHVETS